MSNTPSASPSPRRGPWRFLLILPLTAVIGAGVAWAGGFGGGGHCREGGEWSAEEARDHVGMFADRVLDRVDATDTQKDQIDSVLDKAVPQLHSYKTEGRALKTDFREALSEDQIDRAELERIRQEGLDLADRASATAMDTLVQIATVLTPEQRQELRAAYEER